MTNHDYVDLFAGAGGWDLAAERLGLNGVGVEIDPAACETRRAAGLATMELSVTAPSAFGHYPIFSAEGLIASPPCQTFSAAGKGGGRDEMDKILLALKRWDWNDDDFSDPRTALVLQPARWILKRIGMDRPYKWVCLEQVPPVLPVWRAYAEMLEDLGYFTAVGILNSEQYGVPQTRKRAILIAHRDRPVKLPEPTHSKYYPRNKTKLDEGVLPWVSMATALGWGASDQPCWTVMTARGRQTGNDVLRGSSWRAEKNAEIQLTDAWIDPADIEVHNNYNTGGVPGKKGIRTGNDPAATITSKVDRNKVYLRNGAQKNATVRAEDEPAPTLLSSADNGDTRWVFAGAGPAAERTAGQIPRDPEEPAHTITGKGTASWVSERPSTTVACDSRIWPPGHKVNTADRERLGAEVANERYGDRAGTASIRVTVREAGILQSFPEDYPWQGTKTQQYQQAGNAIPVLLAEAVLREVL